MSTTEDLEIIDNEAAGTGKYEKLIQDGEKRYKLSGMYKDWFLDYASYVILERAVPHISDGLKPVQRRILHAMKRIDDGRYNKVANIIGFTMQYHPHGDASIGDALVQIGQKDLLIDCQGNWGNILTGDSAAAPRYIEARLTKFAHDVVFNPKTTEWMSSYDGRNQEPVNLPMKFPLLLAQGAEGIAVGLASKILPHNFNELIDASIAVLNEKEFELYPDFPTGGLIDCSKYNQGLRGGQIRVRAKILKVDKKTLKITEIPFGKNTSTVIDSIIKANDRGKIKIKRVDDNTAAEAEIVIHLHNDVSPDKTIDALYAFTDCEVSISPNSCVIMDNHPHFLGVDEILRYNTQYTKFLLGRELEIRLSELESDWHYYSLEKIFFENKVYRILENNAATWESQLQDVESEMRKYQNLLKREIVHEDILKLVEKPVRKISRFDVKAVDEKIRGIEGEIDEIKNHLEHLTEFTINHFKQLKKKYGAKYPRKSELSNFENIEQTKVVVTNAKLYANKEEGFAGIHLKKDDNAEFICECSDIDEIIVFLKSGKYIVTKVSDKAFIGKNIIHIDRFIRNDERTIYNAIYRDGKNGTYYAKRFSVTGVTRDKEYDLTKGSPDSAVVWFTANSNGEAECVNIYLKKKPKLKKLIFEFDFTTLAIKNRSSMGNIVSKNPLQKIAMKTKGVSTIGGKSIWFDWDILRLNEDGRGELLGEFQQEDKILAIFKDGTYSITNFDLSNRYQGEVIKIEKYDPDKTWSAIYFDGHSNSYYIKRFSFEISDNTALLFISDGKGSFLVEVSDDPWPQAEIVFGGKNSKKEPEKIDVEEFISKKGFKAKGKRATGLEVQTISFIEPLQKEMPEPEDDDISESDETNIEETPDIEEIDTKKSEIAEIPEEIKQKEQEVELFIIEPSDPSEPTLF